MILFYCLFYVFMLYTFRLFSFGTILLLFCLVIFWSFYALYCALVLSLALLFICFFTSSLCFMPQRLYYQAFTRFCFHIVRLLTIFILSLFFTLILSCFCYIVTTSQKFSFLLSQGFPDFFILSLALRRK